MSRPARTRAELQAAAFDEGFEALCDRLGVQAGYVRVDGEQLTTGGDADVARTVAGGLQLLRRVLADVAEADEDGVLPGHDLAAALEEGALDV